MLKKIFSACAFLMLGSHVFALNEQDAEELMEQSIKRINNTSQLVAPHKNKNSIIIIGPSRSGKSTLINYLAGELKVEQTSCGKVLKAANELPNIKIIHGGNSGTREPASWVNDKVIYYDCTGFGDTEGEGIDIVNTQSVNILFKEAPKFKTLLVIREGWLTDSKTSFFTLLKQVGKIPSNDRLDDFIKSLSLVVTCHEKGVKPRSILKEWFQDAKKGRLNEAGEKILEYFVQHPERVSYLPKPREDNNYSQEFKKKIQSSIDSSEFQNSLQSVHVYNGELDAFIGSLSKKANKDIETNIQQKIIKDISAFADKEIKAASCALDLRNSLENLKNKLKRANGFTNNNQGASSFFDLLNGITDVTFGRRQVSMISFLNRISEQHAEYNISLWYMALSPAIQNLEDLTKINYNSNNTHIEGALLGTGDVNRYLQNRLNPGNMLVKASRLLIVDENIIKPGCSLLTLESPLWKASAKRTFDFRGNYYPPKSAGSFCGKGDTVDVQKLIQCVGNSSTSILWEPL